MFKSSMSYRRMGSSGIKLSALSLGGWTTYGGTVKDRDLIRQIHRHAYEAGINFFDSADIYSKGDTETAMGEALKDFPRHELVISTKVFWPMSDDVNDRGLSRKHIMESINKSLKRLGTDYVDFYFCHRFDVETPMEETIRAMDDLVHQGKVLYWGTSEWSGEQLKEAHRLCADHGYYAPAVEQPQYSLIERKKFESEIAPTASKLGMGLVTWSPLASGLLSGKYDQGFREGRLTKLDWLRESIATPANLEKVKKLKVLADELGCTRSQLSIAWALRQPALTSVILGATRLEQLQENLGALNVRMSSDVIQRLDQIF